VNTMAMPASSAAAITSASVGWGMPATARYPSPTVLIFSPSRNGKYASEAPTDPKQAIAELQNALDKLPEAPTKQPDAKCGDVDCYDVQIKLTQTDLASLSPSEAPSGFTNGVITVDVFSRKSDLRPARLVATMSSAEMGTLTLTVNATYDVSINVVAPPADQVTEASSFPFPSIDLPSLNP